MNESLTKALATATFTRNDLREAHGKGTALESLLLLPMIEQAEMLRRQIENFINAKAAS